MDTEIRLTPKEFELLSLLARNPTACSPPRHPEEVWGRTPSNSRSTCGRWSRSPAEKIEPDPSTASTC